MKPLSGSRSMSGLRTRLSTSCWSIWSNKFQILKVKAFKPNLNFWANSISFHGIWCHVIWCLVIWYHVLWCHVLELQKCSWNDYTCFVYIIRSHVIWCHLWWHVMTFDDIWWHSILIYEEYNIHKKY